MCFTCALVRSVSLSVCLTCLSLSQAFPKCDFLLDNEVQGSGFYLPELDEPEHCNAQNTALWELHLLQVHTHTHTLSHTFCRCTEHVTKGVPAHLRLQRHYHPVVQQLAAHLSQGAPSEGSAALGVELSRRYAHLRATQVFLMARCPVQIT